MVIITNWGLALLQGVHASPKRGAVFPGVGRRTEPCFARRGDRSVPTEPALPLDCVTDQPEGPAARLAAHARGEVHRAGEGPCTGLKGEEGVDGMAPVAAGTSETTGGRALCLAVACWKPHDRDLGLAPLLPEGEVAHVQGETGWGVDAL